MIRVLVASSTRSYGVRVEPGIAAGAGRALRGISDAARLLVVTDRTVARLHGAAFLRALAGAGFAIDVAVLPAGERTKSWDTVRRLCARWAGLTASRETLVVAFGGGVVSDVAGLAASLYARGIPWAVFPTTLVSQADASIGGKVGVNLPEAKNMIGAFHHPVGIFADPIFLETLSPRAFRSGLAEVAKMGFIRRPAILRSLGRLDPRALQHDPAAVASLVLASAREKAAIVGEDERDVGIRRHLNFGHTVGHALEAAYGYRKYTHGEAISVGMAAALRLSVGRAGLPASEAREGADLLARMGLPVSLPGAPPDAFWRALGRDKKRGRLRLRMVLCPAFGAAKVYELPSLTPLRTAVSSLYRKPWGPHVRRRRTRSHGGAG